MPKIEFLFESYRIVENCNDEDLIKDICNIFARKVNKNINNLHFYYSGKKISLDLKYSEIVNQIDKERKCISVLVNSINDNLNNKKVMVDSPYPICQYCQENVRIEIKDYKINILDCKNGHHVNNVSLEEYERIQKVDLTKIKCNVCNQNNKSITYNNQMYKCNTCKVILCPLCKEAHNKDHYIINHDLCNYICKKHNESYNSYCMKCKENLCLLCEKEHGNHEIISYGKMIPNTKELNQNLNEFKKSITEFKTNIENMIKILKDVYNSLEYINKINYDLINNFDIKKLNYEILQNINNININPLMNDIITINEENDFLNKFKKIFNLHKKIKFKDNKETNYNENLYFKDSLILKDKDSMEMIKNWISPDSEICFKLLYRATRDGDSCDDFHSKCNDSPNISLIQLKDGRIIGGYTTIPWKIENNSYIQDKKAFIFSLDSKEKYELKKELNGNKAIYHDSDSYCCCYGYVGDDLAVYKNFLKNNESYCCGQGDYLSFTTSNLKMLGKDQKGKINISIKELEMFKVIDKEWMIDSLIINHFNEISMIKNWINPNGKIYFDLIYRATKDGDSSNIFYLKCQNQAPTISIIKLDNGRIIGGYTTVPWLIENKSYISDKDAFIFSIDSKEKYNLRKELNGDSAVYHSINSYCCCFGYCGDDLAVGNRFLKDQNSYCCGNGDKYYSFDTDNNKMMGVDTKGKIKFKISELEVFKVHS